MYQLSLDVKSSYASHNFIHITMKRWIKIIILFILIVIIIGGGLSMYKTLEYNKQSFSADIYDYAPPLAEQIININKEYDINKLLTYDSTLVQITQFVKNDITYPCIICYLRDNKKALIAKITKDQEIYLKNKLENNTSTYYPPLIKTYKDSQIIIYSLPRSEFIFCAFYQGIFIISRSYKQIMDIIDTDPENTFFTNKEYKKEILDILENTPVGLFIKYDRDLLTFDLQIYQDTIEMKGYILQHEKRDSTSFYFTVLPHLLSLQKNTCIDYAEIRHKDNLPTAKIILNKIH